MEAEKSSVMNECVLTCNTITKPKHTRQGNGDEPASGAVVSLFHLVKKQEELQIILYHGVGEPEPWCMMGMDQ